MHLPCEVARAALKEDTMTETRKTADCPKDVLLRVLDGHPFHLWALEDLDTDDLAVLLRRRKVEAVKITREELDQEAQDGAEHAGDLAAHRKLDKP